MAAAGKRQLLDQVPVSIESRSAHGATEAALSAIARSDGSRRSVARALRAQPQFDGIGDLRRAPVTILRAARPGGSRQNMSLEGGDVVATLR